MSSQNNNNQNNNNQNNNNQNNNNNNQNNSDSIIFRRSINRCQYINEDFNYCNERRLDGQRYCFYHYTEINIPNDDEQEEVNNEESVNNQNIENEEEIILNPIRENQEEENNIEEFNLNPISENDEEDRIFYAMNNLSDIIRRRAISSRNRHNRHNRIIQNVLLNNNRETKIKENTEYDFCLLCDNYVVKPNVELSCSHKYHLNCFIIDNSNQNNGFDLKEKCNKCSKKISYEQEEIQCPICLENIIDHKVLSNLPCEHKFHILCIQQWIVMNKNTCPLCRKSF